MKYLFAAVAILIPLSVIGEALYKAQAQDGKGDVVTVTLHREPCGMADIKNLPRKATWSTKNEVIEGCYGKDPNLPIVVVYWADKTVIAVPVEAFEKADGGL